ncbi:MULTISPECIES: fused MFS/spermidine synthase [unclassified Achromobacter]|uniref:fused MFS/spermidine synthase n=1 Tax=unclassified Achromobacter TaxID=2626865 RepID=UPI000B5173B0|nr:MULTISPECIES: fused MFS/spermidine synthase [unclassified Achromobacter]OWT77323.1 spermidine synthase [Achromobacter sp. HZ28]OWT78204.1 spermidine synthase [Achromobacter sp. HZ34]
MTSDSRDTDKEAGRTAGATGGADAAPRVPALVRDTDSLTLRLRPGGAVQSRMSLRQPDALDLEYTRLMMGFLLFQPEPAHIVQIGLGGGSLAKFCHRFLPRARITVVEIDPRVIAMRDEFRIPPDDARLSVVQGDGADFVRTHAQAADVLLLDGYDDNGLPARLRGREFFEDCRRCLRHHGILVANLHRQAQDYSPCLYDLMALFPSGLLEVADEDLANSIVYASAADLAGRLRADAILRPDNLAKEAWRQLMPTFRMIAATMALR